MGTKLRWQLAAIVFMVVIMCIAPLTWFNLSIVQIEIIQGGLQQARNNSISVFSWVHSNIPPGSFQTIYRTMSTPQRRELESYLSAINNLKSFQLIDARGAIAYSTVKEEISRVIDNPEIMSKISKADAIDSLWAYDTANSTRGEAISSSSLFDTRPFGYEFLKPVIYGGKVAGYVHISLSMEKTSRAMKLIVAANLLLSFLFLVFVFFALSLWLGSAVLSPLNSMLNAQQRVARGEFDSFVDIKAGYTNEFLTLINSFNKMASDLKEYRQELEEKTRTLEVLNEEYRKLNETLEQEVEGKTKELKEFFSLITHDLKIPMSAILGYSELLSKTKTGSLNEKQSKFIVSISSASKSLMKLVKNMLDAVKYESGKVNYFFEEFDVSEVIEDARINLEPQTGEKGINFKVEVPPACRFVKADKQKIGQVFSNLIGNAIYFTPEKGEVKVKARNTGNLIEFTVSDTGQGIPMEMVPMLFQKFTTLKTKDGPSTGIGLGLYIAKKILEGHSQEIRVESKIGRGSSFIFTLPKGEVSSAEEGGKIVS